MSSNNHDDWSKLRGALKKYWGAEKARKHLHVMGIFYAKAIKGEGELVFDTCGCAGNFSIATLELGRQFIYCETNKENYELGSSRIYEALKSLRPQAG